MEKRVFLAIFLSFAVLALYQTYFVPPPPVPPPAAAALEQQPGSTPGAAAANVPPPPTASPAAAQVADPTARDIVVETDMVRAIFNTQGAVLKSWRLLRHLDAKGEPLELIPSDLPPGFPRPFTISTDDAKVSSTLASAVFQPTVDRVSLGLEPGTLGFQYRNDAGLTARKTFSFQPNRQPYVVNVEVSVDQGGAPLPIATIFGPAIGLGYNPDESTRVPERALHFLDGSVARLTASDLQAQPRYEGAIPFAGVEDQYFLIAALPTADRTAVEYTPATLPVTGGADGLTRSFISFTVRTNPGAAPAQVVTTPFFIGPKEFDHLRTADRRLVYAIDFGMFRPIVTPLLQALNTINAFLGNYGWSIVALTIFINILIFPLRHRSMVSMKKMQALQPEVKAIQDRYAKYKVTDPERQKMNSEMMGLYKQKGVNPASGCLPMLLTMPVLLAFYSLLSVAIELRGAPFVGWIHDLAAKDPTYVWPVLMGGTMFWQQKMMPTTADPVQAKIFLLMPVIFTVMFLNMPSGLVIYWLTSNVLTIGQQYLTNRLTSAPARPVGGVQRKG